MHFPKTHFLQFIPSRLKEAAGRLQSEIWTESETRLRILALNPSKEHRTIDQAMRESFELIEDYPHEWGKLFDQRWYRIGVTPSDASSYTHLRWKDQGEATLYCDDLPWAGFDVAHLYAPLPQQFDALYVESTCCQSAIWHPSATGIGERGSVLRGAYLARRNEAAWKAYHDFQVLLDVALFQSSLEGYDAADLVRTDRYRRPLDRLHPRTRRLFARLDQAVDAYNGEGIASMQRILSDCYEEFAGSEPGASVTLTGHAHIDLVWMWPERIGEAKAIHAFSTAQRLMDAYPEFRFGYSQPASYQSVARRTPSLWSKVKERINEGRWEATGALYVESDTQLCCGEALARSFLLGQQWFRKETGAPSSVVWLPDTFGFTGCLPALMQQTGAKRFFTTKQAWSSGTKFPYSSFRWRAADGTEVVSYVQSNLLKDCYNTQTRVEDVVEAVYSHQQAAQSPEVLVPTGYGDGGGGPTEEMCERARRLANLNGIPKTSWGRIDAFFERLGKVADSLPCWQGEIYLENSRGVQTTHVHLKQSYRAFERALQAFEASRCLSGHGPIDQKLWERLVFTQFHDFLPGSSVIEVYEEGIPEICAHTQNALQAVQSELGDDGNARHLFNPLLLERREVVELGGQMACYALPPLGIVNTTQALSIQEADRPRATDASLENGYVSARFDCSSGCVTELSFSGKRIDIAGQLNQLVTFADNPSQLPAWEIDRGDLQSSQPPINQARLKEVENKPCAAAISFELQITERSSATVEYRLNAYDRALRIRYVIDWRDETTLLKTCFPTGYRGKNARYGAPFGSVQRPQIDGDVSADAKFECPASRWALVSDDIERDGLAVISKDRYGFGCREGNLHVSLVRSAKITQNDLNLPLRSMTYAEPYSDLGCHEFELALADGSYTAPREAQPDALAQTLYSNPVIFAAESPVASLGVSFSGGDTLIPSWAKPSEDGKSIVLRLHETRGLSGAVGINLPEGSAAQVTRIDETEYQPIADLSCVPFNPYQIISIRIEIPAS